MKTGACNGTAFHGYVPSIGFNAMRYAGDILSLASSSTRGIYSAGGFHWKQAIDRGDGRMPPLSNRAD